MHVCIYLSIGLSECLSNVALSVPLHASAAHRLSLSGFPKRLHHTFFVTSLTRFPTGLYAAIKDTWTKLHGPGCIIMPFSEPYCPSVYYVLFTASGMHFLFINTNN
jgi:hypothetical protein